MGKRSSERWFTVRKIVGVQRDAETGEVQCLVSWKGFSRAADSWEPLSNLRSVECMIHAYLTAHNIVLEEMPLHPPECPDCSTAATELTPQNRRKMATKTLSKSDPESKENEVICPAVKGDVECVKETPPLVHTPEENVVVRRYQSTSFVVVESEEKNRRNLTKRFKPSVKLVPGRLGVDRPVKIIGARACGAGIEYAILFAPSSGKLVGVGVALHHEVMQKAAWLFSRFFLSVSSVALR